MLAYRIFVAFIGGFYGAFVGMLIAVMTRWLDGLVLLTLVGAVSGWAGGWWAFPRFRRMIDRWNMIIIERRKSGEWFPPPSNVSRLGFALGMAEGIVIGATNGGLLAGIIGGCFGGQMGIFIAAISWRVRRCISILFVALLVGFLIEVVGCLWIAYTVKLMVIDPVFLWVIATLFIVSLTCRYLIQPLIQQITRMKNDRLSEM